MGSCPVDIETVCLTSSRSISTGFTWSGARTISST
jgi:hypothetical protein